jgi:exoribonuclease-2
VRHLKEGQARVEPIPLRLNIPELADQARGARAEIEVMDIDPLALEASVRYLGLIEAVGVGVEEMTDLDGQIDELISTPGIMADGVQIDEPKE